jgi:hypothetical protein
MTLGPVRSDAGAFGRRAVTERAKGIHGAPRHRRGRRLRDAPHQSRVDNRKLIDLAVAVVDRLLPKRPIDPDERSWRAPTAPEPLGSGSSSS